MEHRLLEEELVCPECGDTMIEIDKDLRRRIKIVLAQVTVVKGWYYTYACRKCKKGNIETAVVKAHREPSFIPGGFVTPDAAAHIMVQKFVMGSPLYQQEQELRRHGIPLSRQTMSNCLLWSTKYLITPVYDQLHRELLTRDVLHANETTLQMLHEPSKTAQSKSYMWLYRTGVDTDRPIMLYEYQSGRGACHMKAFLAGFKGYLHTDGYSGYHILLDEIPVVGCLAHTRRKIDEAMKSLPKGKVKNSSSAQGLAYCNLLFKIEEGLANLSPEERYDQRLKQVKPVLDAMLTWANNRTAVPKSALGKAFTYHRGIMALPAQLPQRRKAGAEQQPSQA